MLSLASGGGVAVKLLHAEELARMAGVHKSTVLLAIRKGQLRASHTVGRSARITLDDARAFLEGRGRTLPEELVSESKAPRVGVITESAEVLSLVRSALPSHASIVGDSDLYTSLVAVGAAAPSTIVVDLDLQYANPALLLRSLRSAVATRGARLVALSLRDDLFPLARAGGADAAVTKVDVRGLAGALLGVDGEARPR